MAFHHSIELRKKNVQFFTAGSLQNDLQKQETGTGGSWGEGLPARAHNSQLEGTHLYKMEGSAADGQDCPSCTNERDNAAFHG